MNKNGINNEEKEKIGNLSLKRVRLLNLLNDIFKSKTVLKELDYREIEKIKTLLIKNRSNYITYRTIIILLNYILKNNNNNNINVIKIKEKKKNNGKK